MSDPTIFVYPEGARLPRYDGPPEHIGSISVLQPASPEAVQILRRHAREIDLDKLSHEGRTWREKDGETFELVTSFVSLADPKDADVTAFAISDGKLLLLRPIEAQAESKTTWVGQLFGKRVS